MGDTNNRQGRTKCDFSVQMQVLTLWPPCFFIFIPPKIKRHILITFTIVKKDSKRLKIIFKNKPIYKQNTFVNLSIDFQAVGSSSVSDNFTKRESGSD